MVLGYFFPNKSQKKKTKNKSNEWRNEVSYTTLPYHWKVHWKLFIINSGKRKLRFSPHFLSTACRSTYFPPFIQEVSQTVATWKSQNTNLNNYCQPAWLAILKWYFQVISHLLSVIIISSFATFLWCDLSINDQKCEFSSLP